VEVGRFTMHLPRHFCPCMDPEASTQVTQEVGVMELLFNIASGVSSKLRLYSIRLILTGTLMIRS